MASFQGQTVHFMSSEDMSVVDDESVTLVVTSPPYWNVRDYGGEQIGFAQSYEEYIASLNKVWAECIRVLQPNGKIAINVQPLPIAADQSGFGRRVIQDIMFDIQAFMRAQDLFLSQMIFWDKSTYINNVSWGSYPKPTNIAANTSFEQIYTFVKRGKTRTVPKDVMLKSLLGKHEWRHWAVRVIWDDIAPVIKINQKGENLYGHGAPFPEDIPYRLIRMHTAEGETVLDPFLGSGTTLKVARILNRKGIGFEINEDYAEKIKERIAEDWTPPYVDPQYKTFSSRDLAEIIKVAGEMAFEQGKRHSEQPCLDSFLSGHSRSEKSESQDSGKVPSFFSDLLKSLSKTTCLTAANVAMLEKHLLGDQGELMHSKQSEEARDSEINPPKSSNKRLTDFF